MQTNAALVGADGAVELDAVAVVHMDLALIVHPGHPEHDHPLRRGQPLQKGLPAVQRLVLFNDGVYKRFSASPDKTARKILFRAGFRKSRIIVGTDAHLLKVLYTLFPNRAPKIVTGLLRKSGLELFSQI